MPSLVKKALILALFSPARVLVRHLPLSATWRLGLLGGRVLGAASPERRALMEQELQAVLPGLPPEQIRRIAREGFANYCLSELEVLLYPALDRQFMERMVTVEGREHLDRALAAGRGVLLLQAHFGAFQMVMPAIGYAGYRMNQVSASAALWKEGPGSDAPRRMHEVKAAYEYRLPVQHISVASSMRPVFRALERNEIVGVTVDGGGGARTVRIPFLGRIANFQTGAADLALRTGAAAVPAFILTDPGLHHRLVIHPPLAAEQGASREQGRVALLRQFVALLEEHVRSAPGHYAYTLCLRRSRARVDAYPFFEDHAPAGRPGPGATTTGSTACTDGTSRSAGPSTSW